MESIVQASPDASTGPRHARSTAAAWRRKPRPGIFPLALVALTWGVSGASPHAALPDISFSAESLEYTDLRLQELRVNLEPDGRFELSFAGMRGAGEAIFGGGLAVQGLLEEVIREDEVLALRMTAGALGLEGRLLLWRGPGEQRLELEASGQPATALSGVPGLPPAAVWISRGHFDVGLDLVWLQDRPLQVALSLDGTDLSFDSPDGRYAGEGLALAATGSLAAAGPRFELAATLAAGELLVGDFYRDFADAGLDVAVKGEWAENGLELGQIRLNDGGALALDATARSGQAADAQDWSVEINSLELAFPDAYRRYLEPVAAPWTLDGLELTGTVSWSGKWQAGALLSGDLEVGDFSIVDTRRERFAVTGLEARLRPGDHAFDSRVSWQGLLLGRINFGAGTALLDSDPGTIALVEPLRLDVLGGRLDLAELSIILPGSRTDGLPGPDIRLRASIEDLEMAQMTAALDWPDFGGRISGEIPGVSFDAGVLEVEGEIRFAVFDGLVSLDNLRVERPFGVLPSLAAEVTLTNLDLEQVTSAFSFGQIAGRLDGYVRDLRMLDWKPVAFDAWLGTPARQERANEISRQAVNRLTKIGGGNATAALSSPLMRMFSNFSYRRLGLGCSLANNVCQLRGLGDEGAGVLILEGAGLPKITIRAFNRSIDWPQMLSNLLAISEGDSLQVGEAPDS